MARRIGAFLGWECQHEHTLVVRSVGVTRTVCEDCGHVSFEIQATVNQPFEREDPGERRHLAQAAGI